MRSASWILSLALVLPLGATGCPPHDDHGHDHGPGSDHDHGDGAHDHDAAAPQAPAPTIVNSVTDPVCGMAVTTDSGFSVERDGTRHYFCSEACQQKFGAAPAAEVQDDAHADDHDHDHGDGDHDH